MAREMKDSGIEWIGEIPQEWDTNTVFQIFTQVKNKNSDLREQNLLSLSYGKIKRKNIESTDGLLPESFDGYNIIEADDIVLRLTDLQNDQRSLRVGLTTERGIVTSAYLTIRNRSKSLAKYLYYYLHSFDISKGFYGMGAGVRQGLNWDGIKWLKILTPTVQEQRRIADFLDCKCAEIDSVITDTQRTIEEYKALKQSIITEAVTKGIRGKRPMKDSGIEWIGEIPEDWTVSLLKYSIRWKSEKGTPNEQVLSLYRDYGVIHKDSRDDNHNVTSLDTSGYKVVDVGDFVINKMKAWQGSMAISEYRGIISPAYHVCEITNPQIQLKYFHHLMRNQLYIPEYLRLSTGMRIGQWDLGFDDFKNLPFILPSMEEQIEIVDYIETKSSIIEKLIAAKQQLLAALESYKKSVIYEYVTGKKEVPAEQADVISIVYPYFPATFHTNKRRFAQAILMCRILDQCPKKMGRVKLEKMLFTIENSIGFDFETEYERAAAGPLDVSIYKCEGIISRVNQWYTIKTSNFGVSYVPTKDSSKYKKYYDKYFSSYDQEITRIINFFKDYDADQAEIIATLFAAWNDFLIDHKQFSDEELVDEVLNNWNDSKKRFSREIWLGAIAQMRESDIVPKGYGKHTVRKSE